MPEVGPFWAGRRGDQHYCSHYIKKYKSCNYHHHSKNSTYIFLVMSTLSRTFPWAFHVLIHLILGTSLVAKAGTIIIFILFHEKTKKQGNLNNSTIITELLSRRKKTQERSPSYSQWSHTLAMFALRSLKIEQIISFTVFSEVIREKPWV